MCLFDNFVVIGDEVVCYGGVEVVVVIELDECSG